MKKNGRPTTYTEDLATTICARIAEGEGVRKIAQDPDMPAQSTIHLWIIKNVEGFSERYEEAKTIGAEVAAEEMDHIAETHEDLQRAKLIIDTKKWNLAKKLPKRFGDRSVLTTEDDQGKTKAITGVVIKAE